MRKHGKTVFLMFLNSEIDETYKQEFAKLGITDENKMLTILNGLDAVAEIGYVWYKNNKSNN